MAEMALYMVRSEMHWLKIHSVRDVNYSFDIVSTFWNILMVYMYSWCIRMCGVNNTQRFNGIWHFWHRTVLINNTGLELWMNFARFVYPGLRYAETMDRPLKDNVEGFRLMNSLKINDTIPFAMYKSVRTGLTICIANVEDTIVSCSFAVGNFWTRVTIILTLEFSPFHVDS